MLVYDAAPYSLDLVFACYVALDEMDVFELAISTNRLFNVSNHSFSQVFGDVKNDKVH